MTRMDGQNDMNTIAKFEQRARAVNSLLCVGLDSDLSRIPQEFQDERHPQFAFNQHIIEQTHAYTSTYKPNIAFYESQGINGLESLKLTIEYLASEYPEIVTICDAKRGDIGSTSAQYAQMVFDLYGFDAVTLHPYPGQDGLQPFLDYQDKACIIVCRTSNPGAVEFQDLTIKKRGGKLLWEVVADRVTNDWNKHSNCMLVVGATYPDALKSIRNIVDEMTLLVPGVGAQGGKIEQVIRAGLNNDGLGMILSASRSIIFAKNPATAARKLRDAINLHL